MSTLYAVPWYSCNLDCPHCHVHKRQFTFNKDKFMGSLNKAEYDEVVLFGGEPTMVWAHFKDIIETGKITSVSSNMVMYPTHFIKSVFVPYMLKYNISVATSWNLKRFNKLGQIEKWAANVKALTDENVDVLLLITLTEDLLEAPLSHIIYALGIMEGAGVKKFLFEPYIGLHECNEKADEWLCNFHDNYPGIMDNLIEYKLDNWNCDCSNIYTLEPDGTIRKGCPDYIPMNELTFNEKCVQCEYNNRCRPCMLQRSCSYPKKLAKKLNKLRSEHSEITRTGINIAKLDLKIKERMRK